MTTEMVKEAKRSGTSDKDREFYWTPEKIVALRKRGRMSQEEMSRCLRRSVQTLAAGERGIRTNLTYLRRLDIVERAIEDACLEWNIITGEQEDGMPSLLRKRLESNGKTRFQFVEKYGQDDLLVPIEAGEIILGPEAFARFIAGAKPLAHYHKP